jgi:hypothetical protein
MASGLGTPELTQPNGQAGLAFYLCSQAPAVTPPTVTNLNPASALTSAASTSVTITGTNFEKSGTPDVAHIQVGSVELTSGSFTVDSPTQITADLPAASSFVPPHDQTDGAGEYQVTVTLSDGETSAANLNTGFTFVDDNGSAAALPTVTSVHSFTGTEAGGNTVLVYGAGFTGATGVTVGGVPASSFTVNPGGTKMSVTVPAYQDGVTACAQDGSSFGETAGNDICQAQVQVTSPSGMSHEASIKPLYEGMLTFSAIGVVEVPPGDEADPAATEYDYVPMPKDPGSLASEEGGALVTIRGKGLNLAALEWVNFGDPTQAASQQYFSIVSDTGTEIQITAPGLPILTVDPTNVPVSVMTAAGLSNQVNATYAGIPTVSSVVATGGPTSGHAAGPDTGGTPIEIDGSGLANQATMVTFADIATQFSFGTQFNLTASSDTKLTTHTVAQNPAVVDTQVCTVTDCSPPSSLASDTSDEFILFPPGDPKIDSITPDSGPATGGTQVMITGENLGCVTNVFFGGVAADDATNAQALLDCGSTTTVMVTTPPGIVGTLPVMLSTVESDSSTGVSPAMSTFTYTQPPAQTVTVHKTGDGAGKITSSPKGISCTKKTCSHDFPFGTALTLQAKASSGSSFAGWTGACVGKKTCKLTVDQPLAATAKFTLANCVVPKITGKTLAAARRTLKTHSCRAGKIGHVFSTRVKKGRVAQQKPKAGTHLKHDGKVSLAVSKGP